MLILYFLVKLSSSTCPAYRTHKLSWVSDTSTLVLGPDTNGVYVPATIADNHWGTNPISGAQPLWDLSYPSNPSANQTCYFKKSVLIPGNVSSATLAIGADDIMTATFNGVQTNCNINSWTWNPPVTCNVGSYLTYGNNLLEFTVSNSGGGPACLNYQIAVTYTVNN
jgi:hypothetical protein